MKSENNSWVSIPHPNPAARVRLFCLPYAGGGSAVFYPWSKLLAPAIELCQIHLPGRETRLREPLITEIDSLTSTLAAGITPYLAMPFAFFGHSMGALVVFELSRILRRLHKAAPIHIFLSGHRAAHLPDRHPPLRHKNNEAFVEGVRAYDGTPAGVFDDKELLEIFLPILRADFTLIETYRYVDEEPLDCPITAFGGSEDPRADREEINAWQLQTHSGFRSHILPGGHFFIRPHQPYILRVISKELNGNDGRMPSV